MKTYLVLKIECESCANTGIVYNPLWTEYWRDVETVCRNSADEMREWQKNWWRDKGYPNGPPPAEITCPDCEGTCLSKLRIPLDAIAAYLGRLIKARV